MQDCTLYISYAINLLHGLEPAKKKKKREVRTRIDGCVLTISKISLANKTMSDKLGELTDFCNLTINFKQLSPMKWYLTQ